jgi:phosphoadenosine phosphosulfate reductase
MNCLFPEFSKVNLALERIKDFAPKGGEPYYVGFSGGKDSVVLLKLVKMAGVKFEAFYSPTTMDPPQLVEFIKEFHKDVKFEKARTSMRKLIPQKLMPPTRKVRYCCEVFKECHGVGRTVLLGIRAQESINRSNYKIADPEKPETKKQKMIELCYEKRKRKVNPILDWTFQEVWEFINSKALPYCKLYDIGFNRLGCIGCPLAGGSMMKFELKMFPHFKQMYLKAFDNMLNERKKNGLTTEWKTPEHVMNWWVGEQKPLTGTLFTEEQYLGGY